MTLETKKRKRLEAKGRRNEETADFAEAALARRLADDLDAFLESAADETLIFADEARAPRRARRNAKRPFYKTLLATTAALAALTAGVASTFWAGRWAPSTERKNGDALSTANVDEPKRENDETSLIAWSVESFDESEWSRRLETQLASVDVWGLYASEVEPLNEGEETENAVEMRRDVVAETGPDEEGGAEESEAFEWFSVVDLENVASLEPLKYEPFFQAVAASLL